MNHNSKAVFEAFRKSMLEKTENWKDYLSEEVSLTGPLAQVKGKSAFIEVNTPFFASIKGSQLFQLVESDDLIITQISTTVNTPSGGELTLQVSEWYHIEGGLIQSLTVYFDTDEFRKAFTPA